jgi:hypothetical protein
MNYLTCCPDWNVHWLIAQIAAFDETLAVLRESPPDRIGHGTFLHRYQPGQGYEEIEDIVLAQKIPIGKGWNIVRCA